MLVIAGQANNQDTMPWLTICEPSCIISGILTWFTTNGDINGSKSKEEKEINWV